MYKSQQATLDTVYQSLTGEYHNRISQLFPSIEVTGGTVNMYISNDEAEPANAAAMTLDSSSPLGEDIFTIQAQMKWILFESVSGAPIVKTCNLIKA